MDQLIKIEKTGAVSCDFESIKNHLDEQLQLYTKMVFTEETKKDAKNAVAELRKEKKAFTDRLKDAKVEYMKPWEEFSNKAMEIADMYDQPISKINEQISEFEAKRIEEKKETIKAIYAELVPEAEWAEIIPLAKISNPKWENATYTEKMIKDDIMTLKIDAKKAVETIKGMDSDKCDEALAMYKNTFDLTSCVQFILNYEKQKKEIMAQEEERIKAEAEARIRAEERAKIEAEQKHQEELAKAKDKLIEEFIPVYDGVDAESFTYIIKLTPSEKEALETYMNSIGIEFDELP